MAGLHHCRPRRHVDIPSASQHLLAACALLTAMHLHPAKAQQLIREGAERAMAKIDGAMPYVLPEGVTVELEFEHQARADQAVLMPGVERCGERAVAFRPKDGLEFSSMFRAAMKLAGIRMSP